MPRGRIVEVFGPESSGKTTLVYHIIAEAQKLGGVCAFIDAEHAMDPLYAQRASASTSTSCWSRSPTTASRRSRSPTCSCAPGAVDVVAVDSVAALTPRAELEGQMGDQTVGVQARMMSQAMRKLAGNLNRTQTLCLFTNQIREKVGVMFGSPETQPGGRALKFYSSQRLDIRRIETLKDGTEAVGNRVRVKVVKNKVAAPFRQAEFDIEFGKGISTAGCILDLGIEHNIVTKSGSFFSYGDERLGQGRNNAKAYLDEHPEIAKEIEDKIYEALGLGQDLVAPIEPDDVATRRGPRTRPRADAGAGSWRPRRRRPPPARLARTHGRPARRSRAAAPARPRPRVAALNRRERTVAEMARHARGQAGRAGRRSTRVLARAAEQGYLDDASYARRFAEDRRRLDEWGAGAHRAPAPRARRATASDRGGDRRAGPRRRAGRRARAAAPPLPAPPADAARPRPRARRARAQGLRARARATTPCAATRASPASRWTDRGPRAIAPRRARGTTIRHSDRPGPNGHETPANRNFLKRNQQLQT